jgi:hypothetical protein
VAYGVDQESPFSGGVCGAVLAESIEVESVAGDLTFAAIMGTGPSEDGGALVVTLTGSERFRAVFATSEGDLVGTTGDGSGTFVHAWDVSTIPPDNESTVIVGANFRAGATFDQEGYRWRADDGSEASATWLANQDTDITRPANTRTRLRALVDTAEVASTERFQIEAREVGTPDWWPLSVWIP